MSRPILSRLDQWILRNKTALDNVQVPASGATVSFYGQGASVKADVTVPVAVDPDPMPTDVEVYDCGTIAPGDFIQGGTNASQVLSVQAVVGRTILKVLNTTFADITLTTGVRLIRKTNQPSVYSDPVRLSPIGSQIITPSGTGVPTELLGRILCYVTEPRFDYIVSGGGIPVASPRLFADARGGARPSPSWLNARDFPTLQKAVDALPATGGEVFIPRGVFGIPAHPSVSGAGLVINKPNVTLRGEGPLATILRATDPYGYDVVVINSFACRLYNLQVDGATTAHGERSCIVVNGKAFSDINVSHCLFQDLLVTNASLYGLHLKNVIETLVLNCEFRGNHHAGAAVDFSTTTTVFMSSGFRENGVESGTDSLLTCGMEVLRAAGAMLVGCIFADNRGGYETERGNALDVRDSFRTSLHGCRFACRESGGDPAQLLYARSCNSIIVESCFFDGRVGSANTFAGNGARFRECNWMQLSSNMGQNLDGDIAIVDENGTVNEGIEFANSTPYGPLPVQGGPLRLFGLSAGGMQLYRFTNETQLTTMVPPSSTTLALGSLVWVDSPSPGASPLRILTLDPDVLPPVTTRVWREILLT